MNKFIELNTDLGKKESLPSSNIKNYSFYHFTKEKNYSLLFVHMKISRRK